MTPDMLSRVAGITLAALIPLGSGAQTTDTIYHRTTLFGSKDAALAAGFAAATIAVSPLDRYFARRLQDSATQSDRRLRGAATGFRILGSQGSWAAGAGLYLIGKASGKNRTADLGLHSLEAMLGADLISTGMKTVFGRARPFVDISNNHDFKLFRGLSDDRFRSFPSGHTTNAFAFASTVSRETQVWWPRSRWYIGTVMYGGATLVGLSRMYNNQHWASDVIGGAAIGTIVGLKVVKFQHSHPGNRIDRALLSVNIAPSANGARPNISLRF